MKNLKKVIIPVALAATMSLSAFLVACGDKNGDAWRDQSIWLKEEALVPTEAAELPELSDPYTDPTAAVHDPSIFHDPVSGDYYAYGTHYAFAKVADFADAFRNENGGGWVQLADDKDGSFKTLYGDESFYHSASRSNWPTAIQETVELVNPGSDRFDAATTTWAPDVEYINGKYYMYYSLTRGFGSRESAIARVESTSPEGPFSNNKIIIDSIGGSNLDPNCIDPELFYDKDGKLWMVFGSAAGGIYIKELHATGTNAGLPVRTKEQEGFGKLIWRAGGGAGENEEGPFVFYNASTKYYYLMTSHASLMSTYNMHIARSENPDGPYVGINGNDVAEKSADGNLVSGNYKFNRSGSGKQAFAALGHNSVVKDKNGKYYVIYHSRTATASGSVNQGHNLYVSQMYFNEAGWPVMAPTPYVGETRGTMTQDQVATTYEIVIHAVPQKLSGTNTASFVNSVDYTLTNDGKVKSGATEVGAWELKQSYYIEITISGKTYKGVVAPGWDTYTVNQKNQKGVITITAVSEEGIPLWAIQK